MSEIIDKFDNSYEVWKERINRKLERRWKNPERKNTTC